MCNILIKHSKNDTIRLIGVLIMSKTTNLSIRIDRDLKEEADQIFNLLGMNLTTAINIFVRQAVRQKKIPFEISLYPENNNTSIAMRDAIAASERIWQNSIQNGTDKMTLEKINAEIAKARAERQTHGAGL